MRVPDKMGRIPCTTHGDHLWCAWRLAPRLREGSAHVRGWVIHCPELHPAWSWWLLSVVHLRPIEGQREPNKHYAHAEYELAVHALDPRCAFDLDDPTTLVLLRGAIVEEQFNGLDDDAARELLDALVELVVRGDLPPDVAHRSRWKAALWTAIEGATTGSPQGHA